MVGGLMWDVDSCPVLGRGKGERSLGGGGSLEQSCRAPVSSTERDRERESYC